jgi:hypothetical protein
VYRAPDEVFDPATIASFEGMPVTDDHPPEGVDIENVRRFQRGHAHNVRRGAGAESDLLLADLIITDPRLIDAILGGKREISCGYTYELCFEEGRCIQRKIRGNHIAVVDAGRAGHRVSIRDHRGAGGIPPASAKAPRAPLLPVFIKGGQLSNGLPHIDQRAVRDGCPPVPPSTERRETLMKKPICKLLARMAKDGDVESVAEIIEELITAENETPEETAEPVAVAVATAGPGETAAVEAAESPETKAPASDDDPLRLILEKLDQLIALLTPAVPAADEETAPLEEVAEIVREAVETAEAEKADELTPAEVEAIVAEVIEPEVSSVLPPDDNQEGDCNSPDRPCSADALRAALTAVRPTLAGLSVRERRKVCGDIAARLYGRTPAADAGVYAALASSRRRPAGSAGSAADLGRRIMEKRNPNYRK